MWVGLMIWINPLSNLWESQIGASQEIRYVCLGQSDMQVGLVLLFHQQAGRPYVPTMKNSPSVQRHAFEMNFFKDLHSGALSKWLKLALDSELFFDIFGLYAKALSKKEDAEEMPYREQLLSLSKVIDRSSNLAKESGKRGLNNDFLLALILIPWANSKFDLVNQKLKGAAAFRFSKILREELDKGLGVQLNLRRSIRQEIVILLSNLPQFLRHKENSSWPKWIKKKSYYKSCSLFCELYSESLTGDQAELNLSVLVRRESHRSDKAQQARSKGRGRRRKGYNPSYSSHKKGIFGLKK